MTGGGEKAYVEELPVGAELNDGRYTIERFINAGGFGMTYLARNTLNAQVVIKECYPQAICRRDERRVSARNSTVNDDFQSSVNWFEKEAYKLSTFKHPQIVRVHDLFRENGTAYMVLDFIEGKDLYETVEKEPHRLTPEFIQHLTLKLLPALDYVHEHDMLHRDIAPDNVMLNHADDPVFIDFGAAREEATRASRALSSIQVVKDGYSPQELYVVGSQQGPYSDVYALAATLWHCIMHRAPLSAQARSQAIVQGEADPLEKLAGRVPGYPAGFLEAIDRGLELAPRMRWQTAKEWHDAITGKVITQEVTEVVPSVDPSTAQTRLLGSTALEAANAQAGIATAQPQQRTEPLTEQAAVPAQTFERRPSHSNLRNGLIVGGGLLAIIATFGGLWAGGVFSSDPPTTIIASGDTGTTTTTDPGSDTGPAEDPSGGELPDENPQFQGELDTPDMPEIPGEDETDSMPTGDSMPEMEEGGDGLTTPTDPDVIPGEDPMEEPTRLEVAALTRLMELRDAFSAELEQIEARQAAETDFSRHDEYQTERQAAFQRFLSSVQGEGFLQFLPEGARDATISEAMAELEEALEAADSQYGSLVPDDNGQSGDPAGGTDENDPGGLPAVVDAGNRQLDLLSYIPLPRPLESRKYTLSAIVSGAPSEREGDGEWGTAFATAFTTQNQPRNLLREPQAQPDPRTDPDPVVDTDPQPDPRPDPDPVVTSGFTPSILETAWSIDVNLADGDAGQRLVIGQNNDTGTSNLLGAGDQIISIEGIPNPDIAALQAHMSGVLDQISANGLPSFRDRRVLMEVRRAGTGTIDVVSVPYVYCRLFTFGGQEQFVEVHRSTTGVYSYDPNSNGFICDTSQGFRNFPQLIAETQVTLATSSADALAFVLNQLEEGGFSGGNFIVDSGGQRFEVFVDLAQF